MDYGVTVDILRSMYEPQTLSVMRGGYCGVCVLVEKGSRCVGGCLIQSLPGFSMDSTSPLLLWVGME